MSDDNNDKTASELAKNEYQKASSQETERLAPGTHSRLQNTKKKPCTINKTNDQHERDAHLEKVAELRLQGYSPLEIARITDRHVNAIYYDIKCVLKQYVRGLDRSKQIHIAAKLDDLREVRKQAYQAWIKSGKESTEYSIETTKGADCKFCRGSGYKYRNGTGSGGAGPKCEYCKGSGKTDPPKKISKTVKERVPDGKFLSIILQTIEQERALLGLDAPKKVDMKAAIATIPWDTILNGDTKDPVTVKFEQAEAALKATVEGAMLIEGSNSGVEGKLLALESGTLVPEENDQTK